MRFKSRLRNYSLSIGIHVKFVSQDRSASEARYDEAYCRSDEAVQGITYKLIERLATIERSGTRDNLFGLAKVTKEIESNLVFENPR